MSSSISPTEGLKHTPLYDLHLARQARMVPFAGYAMPVQYPTGILAEHAHTRASAGLFDVSHMGQALIEGEAVSRDLESLVPSDLVMLAPGHMRYTLLLNPDGGILDDLIITRIGAEPGGRERLFLVVNASRKDADFAWLSAHLPAQTVTVLGSRALVAVQGPKAAAALARHLPGVLTMAFMTMQVIDTNDTQLYVSRSGYTGEDGFEISLPAAAVETFVQALLAEPEIKPVGLGARDTLRLEAGLCLYGHDIDETTSPVEAALSWSISPRRRAQGGFFGAERIRQELADGPARRRVGLLMEGRVPAREGAEIAAPDGAVIGRVTSGGFSPSRNVALAMGYVGYPFSSIGTALNVVVRGRPLPARVVKMPFVPTRYYRVQATDAKE
jgi:aminomethyltransferase